MTLRAPYYQHEGVTIYNGDCLSVLPELPDSSVDLILTDPPYFKVKGDAWDNQWDKPGDFLAWLDRVLAEFARVLKPNGSLYLFASPQMGARVECLVGGRFAILNSITWRKPPFSTKAEMNAKEGQRSYFPVTERIIFAEHFGADTAAKGEAGYERQCDELRGFVFEPIRAYLDSERLAAGLSVRQVAEKFQQKTGSRTVTGMAGHWFTSVQWALPTHENYIWLQSLAEGRFRRQYEDLRRQYEDLRRQYEDLRRQYEDLRRPFTVTANVPYTDVWDFETVGNYQGKHACEKPAALLRHMISASSKPGAVVLDAFGGSGSTAQAARELGRSAISIELDERWCRKQADRVKQRSLF